jgi:DNA-binding beta-propeller fold protein YncE
VNQDGSRLAAAVTVGTTTQVDLLSQTLNLLGSYDAAQSHGLVFSRDGQSVYVSESKNGAPEITVLATANLSATGEIPDPQVQAKSTEIEDADDAHILYGVGNRGIALIDAGHPVALPSTFLSFSQVPVSQPDGGPNSGGTVVQLAGENLEVNSQVKFGTQLSSSVQSESATQIQAASPSNTASGPVSLTAFFPSGWLAVAPAAFSYGPEIREILPNAGKQAGGEFIAIYGFGFGSDPSKVTVSIGGASANVQKLETLPAVADSLGLDSSFPLPIERLTVVTPPGAPSNADVSITAPSGKFTLPHAFQFLQSEQVFAKAGFYKFLSYDEKRQWIYMSNIDHLDVFDLAASQFRGGIQPPGGPPPNAQLRASALTPDGSQLVVADFGAQSIYLINPDTASGNSISVGGVPGFANSGPARVAATNNSAAFVGLAAEGSSNGCVTCLGQLDLTANPVTIQPAPQPELSLLTGAPFLASDLSGSHVFFSFETAPGGPLASWDSSSPSQFATLAANANTSDLAAAADGTFVAARTAGGLEIRSSNLGLMSSPATPELERIPGRTEVPGIALHPSGSLIYEPFLTGPAPVSLPIAGVQGGVDIVDSHTGRLRLRIMLPEPPAMLAADSDGLRADFLAIDENGQRIFALTASGLTVVQLSSVPLSIGSISPAAAPGIGGTTLTIRGSGFQSGTKITIGGKSASANFQDMNTLTVLTPSLPSGAQQIGLTNPNGETYSLDAAFTAQ